MVLRIVTFLVFSASTILAQKPFQPLLDSIEVIMEKENVPGLLLSITTKDSIIYAGGLGFANIDKKEKASADHLFRMGSISKGFTALGLLKLESEGAISLKDKVSDIDPDLKGKWPVTIEQVLEHTAGFDDMRFKAVYNLRDEIEPSTKEIVKLHATSLKSRWKPGQRMSYSNSGYALAGHMIETVSRRPYAEYLKEEVLDSIGMSASHFAFKRPKSNLMVEGYSGKGKELLIQDYVSIQGGAAGSLVSNANDMATYLMWVMSKGEGVIPVEKFDRWERAQTTLAAQKGLPGGYGLGNGNRWKNGYRFHGHTGGVDGFASDYVYSREANIGVVLATNSRVLPRRILKEILSYFITEKGPTNKLKAFPISQEFADKYTGFYLNKSPRNQYQAFANQMWSGHNVHFNKDTMFSVDLLQEWRDTLYHAGNEQFFFKDSGIPHVMFIGDDVLWQFSDYAERSSLALHWTRNIIVLLSFMMVFPFVLYGSFWLLISYIKGWKRRKNRWIMWSACASFISFFALFSYCGSAMAKLGTFHFGSILLFVNSILFPVLAIVGIQQAIVLKTSSTFYRLFYWATALSLIVITLLMLANNFVGFRMWAY